MNLIKQIFNNNLDEKITTPKQLRQVKHQLNSTVYDRNLTKLCNLLDNSNFFRIVTTNKLLDNVLRLAITERVVVIAEVCIKYGADINVVDQDTPMGLLGMVMTNHRRHVESAKFLLRNKIDINRVFSNGKDVLHLLLGLGYFNYRKKKFFGF